MTGPEHYRRGEEWLARAEAAYQRMAQEPTAAQEAANATAIATAHFAAAHAAWAVHTGSWSETSDWNRAVGRL